MKHDLNKYAELVISQGLRFKEGDRLVIRGGVDMEPFLLRLTEQAYKHGASEVRIDWRSQEMSKLHFAYRTNEELQEVDKFLVDRELDAINKKYKYLSVVGEDPNGLADADQKKVMIARQASAKALFEFSKKMMANYTSWCVIGCATPAWAKALFPELKPHEALEKLWDLIFYTMRLDQADPVKAWEEHINSLKKRSSWLNEQQFTTLHYRTKQGTDLHLGLAEGYKFIGADEHNSDGELFIANMPTEEVFSMPHAQRVDGVVYNTKPLNLNGTLVDDFHLTFADGKVVDFAAGKGYEALANLLDMDEGARRLGEVALVPYHSPISLTGELFCHTLFDENASCHLALGKAYPTTNEHGHTKSEDELKEMGMNVSLIHVDFMIGDESLEIDGETKDGKMVPVFRNGDFVIDQE